MLRFPSVKTIQSRLGVERETAKTIRGLMDGSIDPYTFQSVQTWVERCYNEPTAQECEIVAINEVMRGFGDEAITGETWVDSFHCNIIAVYVNMGDPYSGTVLYDTERGSYAVCTWGDWVETYERYRGRIQ